MMKIKVVKKSNNINCNLSRHKKSEADRNIIPKDFFFLKRAFSLHLRKRLLKIHQWSFL